MPDYGLKKNSEGYADPTAYEGITNAPKPGEIWMSYDSEMLIVSNNGDTCFTLKLLSEDRPGCMKVGTRYTNPARLGYAYIDRLGYCTYTISESELSEVLAGVHNAIGGIECAANNAPCSEAEYRGLFNKVAEDEQYIDALEKERRGLARKIDVAESKYDMLKSMYDDIVNKLISAKAAAL